MKLNERRIVLDSIPRMGLTRVKAATARKKKHLEPQSLPLAMLVKGLRVDAVNLSSDYGLSCQYFCRHRSLLSQSDATGSQFEMRVRSGEKPHMVEDLLLGRYTRSRLKSEHRCNL